MIKLLFICTHNRCRSILAEAITNHHSGGRIEARSAGSQPAGAVHPLTLRFLKEKGIETQGLKSQSWDDHQDWKPDVVITVCDSAAGETCPLWFGNAVQLHWGLPDPSCVQGPESSVSHEFNAVMSTLENRVKRLLGCSPESMDSHELQNTLNMLGAEQP